MGYVDMDDSALVRANLETGFLGKTSAIQLVANSSTLVKDL